MNFEVGKIVIFDGYYGKLVSENGEYFFLNTDIDSEMNVEVGSLVAFRGEEVNGQLRAFFIKPPEEFIKIEKNKEKVYHE